MCRAARESGRRCPCDTASARRIRRANSQLRAKHADEVGEKPKDRSLLTDTGPITVEEVREKVAAYNEFMEPLLSLPTRGQAFLSAEQQKTLDRLVIEAGAAVERLAEEKFGAPTDEEFKTVLDESAMRQIQELDHKRKEAAKDLWPIVEKVQKRIAEDPDEARRKISNPARLEYMTDLTQERVEGGFLMTGIISKAVTEYGEDGERAWALCKKVDDARTQSLELRRTINEQLNERENELFKKRNVAYQAALREAGVQFADKNSLKVTDDSNSWAEKEVRNVTAYYPEGWVQASNKAAEERGVGLRLKKTTGRAHYSAQAIQKTMKSRQVLGNTEEKDADWQPDPRNEHDLCLVEVPVVNGEYTYVDPYGYKTTFWQTPQEGRKLYVSVRHERKHSEKKPRGDWKQVTVKKKQYVNGEWKEGEDTYWHRPQVTRRQSFSHSAAEVTVSSEFSKVGEGNGHRVAIHEMAHRFEDTVPGVKLAEDAFLTRRAGKHENPDVKMEMINGMRGEVGYKDKFHQHYSGRVYPDGSREILSVGMETMFAGNFGGFTYKPLTTNEPDADYRRFVLGLLTLGAKRQQS